MARGLFACLVAAALAWGVAPARAGAADKPVYNVYIHTGQSKGTNAQIHTLLKEATEAIKKEMGLEFNYQMADTLEDFLKAMGEGKVDVGYSLNYAPYLKAVDDKSHRPVLSAGFYKMKQEHMCLYVGKDSPYKSLEDLKAANMTTYKGEMAYYMLRELTRGGNPAGYFKALKLAPNGFSTAFSVAMGETDAGFIATSTMRHMQEINPFTKTKVRKLDCWGPTGLRPLFVKNNVPTNITDRLTQLLANWKQEPSLERLKPLLRKTGLVVFKVTPESYQWLVDIRRKGRDKGWLKDYTSFLLQVEEATLEQ